MKRHTVNQTKTQMKNLIILFILSVVSVAGFAQEKEVQSEIEKKLLEERKLMEKELEEMRMQQKELLKQQQEILKQLEKQRAKEVKKAKEQEKKAGLLEQETKEEAINAEETAIDIPEIPELPEFPKEKTKNKNQIIVIEEDDGTEVDVLGIVKVKEGGDSTVVQIGKKQYVASETGNKVSVRVVGEDDEADSETTISFSAGDRNRVFQGFEFGFSSFSYDRSFDTDIPDDMEYMDLNVGKSINWAINPFEMDVRLIKEYVKFSTGIGYNVKNFSFSGDSYLVKADNDSIMGIDSGKDLKKNRLRVGYITVPAMLHFNTSKNSGRAFRVGVGVQGGLKLYQTYRTKYFEDGHKTKQKQNGGWNTRDFILDGRAVVGYGPINLYANYALASLFKKDKGPEVYPYTIGVSFVQIFE